MKDKMLSLIKRAMLAKNEIELNTFRAIKTKFVEFETSKNAKELNESEEIKILNKMVKERIETASIYEENNRQELADKELAEAEIIKQYLPKEATKEEIEIFVDTLGTITKNEMGLFINKVKSKFKNADGKIVADIVKSKIIS